MKLLALTVLAILSNMAFAQEPVMVKNINPNGHSNPKALTCLNNKVYFSANTLQNGRELWVSDGTENGTYLQSDVNTGAGVSDPHDLVAFNNKLYFTAYTNETAIKRYVTDGNTPAVIFDMPTVNTTRQFGNFTVMGSKLFFYAEDAGFAHGCELWATDGTTAGTAMVKDILPGDGSSTPRGMAVYNNRLYFSAQDATHGIELWVSDGTENGTELFVDINLAGSSKPANFTLYDNKLYFTATDTAAGTELWVTDGTVTGTTMVKDINYRYGNANPQSLVAYKQYLLFAATDTLGSHLWRTDGTDSGTVVLDSIVAFPKVGFNDRLYFLSQDTFKFTNYIGAKTQIVSVPDADLNAIPQSNLCVCNGSLYFGAQYFASTGIELYKLNTAQLTLLDENPAVPYETLVYPNPATNSITIYTELDKPVLTVYSASGSLLHSATISRGNNLLTTDNFDNGLYFIHLQAGTKTVTQKLIISR
ncbi:MAG: T9SS type A sorting domain-containing protein [Sphingobacteriales bacterium JAD_PAG50586_3]|nr:MAG: T9SS type A sorting domain-containing protein [Sphingobacteriales bacterium JAD_PAG50586_3]